jgi:hypothetical protein
MPKSKKRSWIRPALLGFGMAVTGLVTALIKKPARHSEQKELVHRDVMYEGRDVNASVIGWVAIGVVLSGLIIHGVVKLSYAYFSRTQFAGTQPVTMVKEAPKPARLPQLQVSPAQDLEQLQRADQQVLKTYGWVDRDKGVVRIPIGEAMKRVLEKGLPPAQKASASPGSQAAK